jgi:hypothetical protein
MKKFLIIVFSTLTSVFGAAKYTGLMYETNTGLVFPGNLSYAVTNVSGGQANHLTNNIRFYGALNPVSIEELFKGTVSVLAFGATTNKADNTTNIQAALRFWWKL